MNTLGAILPPWWDEVFAATCALKVLPASNSEVTKLFRDGILRNSGKSLF
jgi:hypothetical protein